MARQWKKTRESDLAKHAFSLAYEQTQPLIFHTLGRPDRLLSGVRTSENQIIPGAQLYMPVRHQWAYSVHCAVTVYCVGSER